MTLTIVKDSMCLIYLRTLSCLNKLDPQKYYPLEFITMMSNMAYKPLFSEPVIHQSFLDVAG